MIEINAVTKNFDNTKALDSVSFKIKKGEIVGLLGPNGAGKTTTLRIIAGVFPPSAGKVLIDDRDLSRYPGQLKQKIGYLPEDNPLYTDMTVADYLRFWAEIKGLKGEKFNQAIDFVVKATQIESVYFRIINELSKGFKQRVGLSQAILTKPEILVLDEPTEGLDPNQRQQIQKLISTLGKNRTVIIASHVLSEIAQIAKRMIIISRGQIVGDDTVSKLKQQKSGLTIIEAEIQGRAIIASLKKLKGIKKVAKKDHNFYQIEAESKKDIRNDIFDLAKKKNWKLLTLNKKEVALEDVFTKLTKE
jgi:ABC-2 type transport system ATP-binding protein